MEARELVEEAPLLNHQEQEVDLQPTRIRMLGTWTLPAWVIKPMGLTVEMEVENNFQTSLNSNLRLLPKRACYKRLKSKVVEKSFNLKEWTETLVTWRIRKLCSQTSLTEPSKKVTRQHLVPSLRKAITCKLFPEQKLSQLTDKCRLAKKPLIPMLIRLFRIKSFRRKTWKVRTLLLLWRTSPVITDNHHKFLLYIKVSPHLWISMVP